MKEKTIINHTNFDVPTQWSKYLIEGGVTIDQIYDFGFRGETPEMKLKKERNVKLEDLLA